MSHLQYRRYHPESRRKKPFGFHAFLKLVLLLVFLGLGLNALSGFFGKIKEDKRDEVTLNALQDGVELKAWGQEEFEDAAEVQILLEGDEVRTQEGAYATLSFQNGTQIFLDQSSRLALKEYKLEGDDDRILLQLSEGRIFVDQMPNEKGDMNLTVATDLINIQSMAGEFLAQNAVTEGFYVFEGPIFADFVDRGPQDVVIEKASFETGQSSRFDAEKSTNFLDRKDVNLMEDFSLEDFETDSFVAWAKGEEALPIDAFISESEEEEIVVEEDPEEETQEEIVEEPVLGPKIAILSPNSPFTLTESGIGLEGKVISGEIARITVTWSGDGTPYELSMYVPGTDSFRYVADLAYGNLMEGENVYTVVAYDAEGKASPPIRIVVNK